MRIKQPIINLALPTEISPMNPSPEFSQNNKLKRESDLKRDKEIKSAKKAKATFAKLKSKRKKK